MTAQHIFDTEKMKAVASFLIKREMIVSHLPYAADLRVHYLAKIPGALGHWAVAQSFNRKFRKALRDTLLELSPELAERSKKP